MANKYTADVFQQIYIFNVSTAHEHIQVHSKMSTCQDCNCMHTPRCQLCESAFTCACFKMWTLENDLLACS